MKLPDCEFRRECDGVCKLMMEINTVGKLTRNPQAYAMNYLCETILRHRELCPEGWR